MFVTFLQLSEFFPESGAKPSTGPDTSYLVLFHSFLHLIIFDLSISLEPKEDELLASKPFFITYTEFQVNKNLNSDYKMLAFPIHPNLNFQKT